MREKVIYIVFNTILFYVIERALAPKNLI
jgi:hypothetical protein